MLIMDIDNKKILIDSCGIARHSQILLATLLIFQKHGKEEVSISEFQESISNFQQKSGLLKYKFSERFLLSPDLLSDLEHLNYRAYIRDYHYRLDSLLPKRFISLTALGRGICKKIAQTLTDRELEDLTTAVNVAMKNYQERWRLWAR